MTQIFTLAFYSALQFGNGIIQCLSTLLLPQVPSTSAKVPLTTELFSQESSRHLICSSFKSTYYQALLILPPTLLVITIWDWQKVSSQYSLQPGPVVLNLVGLRILLHSPKLLSAPKSFCLCGLYNLMHTVFRTYNKIFQILIY